MPIIKLSDEQKKQTEIRQANIVVPETLKQLALIRYDEFFVFAIHESKQTSMFLKSSVNINDAIWLKAYIQDAMLQDESLLKFFSEIVETVKQERTKG